MATIIKRTINGRNYYYISRSYRVKEPGSAPGKGPWSGKSRVRSEQVYLGTVEEVLRKIQQKASPEIVRTRSFGIEAAAVRIIQELDLINIIDRHVEKRHQGLSVGQYLAVALINRIVRPTSRAGIADWAATSALPSMMKIDPRLLKSKNFWDAFDKMLAEPTESERSTDPSPEVLDDQVIQDIELDVWEQLRTLYDVPMDPVLYDTTNYFTHMDPQNPSQLGRFAKSKDGKKGKRCVGLALAQSLSYDLPMFHLAYAANCHDAKLFPTALLRLTRCFSAFSQKTKHVTLIMDKGNNSQGNVQLATQKYGYTLIGSLVPRHVPDLMRKQLRSFTHTVMDVPAYQEAREVFGIPATVVVTYNSKLKRRQAIRLEERLQKAEERVGQAIGKFKKSDSKKKMEERIGRILRSSGMRRYLQVTIGGRRNKTFSIDQVAAELKEKRRMLGKTVLFCTDPSRPVEEVVILYRKRDRVEKTFRLSKGRDGIPFHPMHCWTDSKIKVYCFICVLALLVWRLIHVKLTKAGFPMTDGLLRMELGDIREVILLFSADKAEHRLSECSAAQRQLLSILNIATMAPPE